MVNLTLCYNVIIALFNHNQVQVFALNGAFSVIKVTYRRHYINNNEHIFYVLNKVPEN